MGILRKLAAWGVVGFAALLLVFFAMPTYRQGEASVAGKTARDFPLEFAGKPAHLADLKGKVVVVNFWATWCPPCVEETPSLSQFAATYADKGVVVLGVSVDRDDKAYRKFLDKYKPAFMTVREDKLHADYGTFMYPETYVIDAKGKVLEKYAEEVDWTSPKVTSFINSVL